jgi:hypothetical protein
MLSEYFVGKVFVCFMISYSLTFLINFAYLKAKKLPTPVRLCFWTIFVGLVIAGLLSFFESFEQGVLLRAGSLGLVSSILFSVLFLGRNALIAQQVMAVLARSLVPDIRRDIEDRLSGIDALEDDNGRTPSRS